MALSAIQTRGGSVGAEAARARVLGEFAADLHQLEERLPASRLGGR
jgi:hypothetical protein